MHVDGLRWILTYQIEMKRFFQLWNNEPEATITSITEHNVHIDMGSEAGRPFIFTGGESSHTRCKWKRERGRRERRSRRLSASSLFRRLCNSSTAADRSLAERFRGVPFVVELEESVVVSSINVQRECAHIHTHLQ